MLLCFNYDWIFLDTIPSVCDLHTWLHFLKMVEFWVNCVRNIENVSPYHFPCNMAESRLQEFHGMGIGGEKWNTAWVRYDPHQNFMASSPPPQPRYFARICAAAFLWCQVLSEDRTKERPRYTHSISGFSCKYRYLIINLKFLGKFYQLGIFKLKCVSLTNNFISRWVLANVWFYQQSW